MSCSGANCPVRACPPLDVPSSVLNWKHFFELRARSHTHVIMYSAAVPYTYPARHRALPCSYSWEYGSCNWLSHNTQMLWLYRRSHWLLSVPWLRGRVLKWCCCLHGVCFLGDISSGNKHFAVISMLDRCSFQSIINFLDEVIVMSRPLNVLGMA